jgi:hypothetical protein
LPESQYLVLDKHIAGCTVTKPEHLAAHAASGSLRVHNIDNECSDLDIDAIKLPDSNDNGNDNIIILDHDPSHPPPAGEADSGDRDSNGDNNKDKKDNNKDNDDANFFGEYTR